LEVPLPINGRFPRVVCKPHGVSRLRPPKRLRKPSGKLRDLDEVLREVVGGVP